MQRKVKCTSANSVSPQKGKYDKKGTTGLGNNAWCVGGRGRLPLLEDDALCVGKGKKEQTRPR